MFGVVYSETWTQDWNECGRTVLTLSTDLTLFRVKPWKPKPQKEVVEAGARSSTLFRVKPQ